MKKVLFQDGVGLSAAAGASAAGFGVSELSAGAVAEAAKLEEEPEGGMGEEFRLDLPRAPP